MTELRRAGEDFASLLATRRLSGGEAFRLRGSLDACRSRERELVASCRRRTRVDERFVRQRLTAHCDALLGRLQDRLLAVPVAEELPTTSDIEKELQAQVAYVLTQVWREASARFQNFASSIGQEVESSLQQARLATGSQEPVRFLLPQVPALNVAADSFEEAWTGLFTGGLFGLFIGGPLGVAIAVGGWLAGLILGSERQRKRETARVIERARSSLTAALDAVLAQVYEKISIYLGSLEHHVTDRISVFVHDVEEQLKKLGTPTAPEEQRRLEACEQAVRGTVTTLADTVAQLGLEGSKGE